MLARAAAPALGAALLFGASTPLAKLAGVDVAPQLLAGLGYLSSGAGLALVLLARLLLHRGLASQLALLRIPTRELPWLAGAMLAGASWAQSC